MCDNTHVQISPLSRNPKFIDLTGRRFYRLIVVSFWGIAKGHCYWNCECDCGSMIRADGGLLKQGKIRSCKCLQRENRTKHRKSGTDEYHIYMGAKTRCRNPNSPGYVDYGGRGIEFRFKSFQHFLIVMGRRPSPQHSLDRFPDNNGHYEPGNVRWATSFEQTRNSRRNKYLTLGDTTLTVTDWSIKLGMGKRRVRIRLNNGWCINCAIAPDRRRCMHVVRPPGYISADPLPSNSICTICQLSRPSNQFYVSLGRRDNRCKPCRNSYLKVWNKKNRDKRNFTQRRYRARLSGKLSASSPDIAETL